MKTDAAFEFQLSQIETWGVFAHIGFRPRVEVSKRLKIIRKVIVAFCKAVGRQHCRLRYVLKHEGDGVLQHVHYHLLIDSSSLRGWDKAKLASEFSRCWTEIAGYWGNCEAQPFDHGLTTPDGDERGLSYMAKVVTKLNPRGYWVDLPHEFTFSPALQKHLARIAAKRANKPKSPKWQDEIMP